MTGSRGPSREGTEQTAVTLHAMQQLLPEGGAGEGGSEEPECAGRWALERQTERRPILS